MSELKQGLCPNCGSDELYYAVPVVEYYAFELFQFPRKSGNGPIELGDIVDTGEMTDMDAYIVCHACHKTFKEDGSSR
jgi:hypothetical protein